MLSVAAFPCIAVTLQKKTNTIFSYHFGTNAFKPTHSSAVSATGCLQLFSRILFSRRHTIFRVLFPLRTNEKFHSPFLFFSSIYRHLLLSRPYHHLVTTLWERHIQNVILSSMLSEYIYHCEHQRKNHSPTCKSVLFCTTSYVVHAHISFDAHISKFIIVNSIISVFENKPYNFPEQHILS